MRATPSFRRFARTMARPPSSTVMCEVSTRAPSAMPTRSAPSSRAFPLISAAVSGFRNISMLFLLAPLELLQLLRHHSFVTLGSHPARIPLGEPAARFAALARLLPFLLDRGFLRRALGNHLLHFGEMSVVVVAHRTNGKAARAVAEGAHDAQQSLPEAEEVARLQHVGALLGRCIDDALHELQHG